MPWQCPTCGRHFRNTSQWHSCATRGLDEHLSGKADAVRLAFERLHDVVVALPGVTVSPSKTSIQFTAGANFLSVRIKQDHLEIEFQLPAPVEGFPICTTKRISKNRVWHQALIEDPSDVDARVIEWVTESYELVSGNR